MDNKKNVVALFDLDGVVIDTETQYTEIWTQIGEKYFPEIPRFAHLIKGMTLLQIKEKYFADKPSVYSEIKQLHDEFERQMTYNYIPGVEKFLKELEKEGIPRAVVTSSDEKKMQNVYAAQPELRKYFDRIFTAEHFARSKPAPDCYLLGAEVFSLPPNRCFVFEDSINGLLAGNAAEMNVIALATTNPQSTIAQYASLVIPSFADFNTQKMMALLA